MKHLLGLEDVTWVGNSPVIKMEATFRQKAEELWSKWWEENMAPEQKKKGMDVTAPVVKWADPSCVQEEWFARLDRPRKDRHEDKEEEEQIWVADL